MYTCYFFSSNLKSCLSPFFIKESSLQHELFLSYQCFKSHFPFIYLWDIAFYKTPSNTLNMMPVGLISLWVIELFLLLMYWFEMLPSGDIAGSQFNSLLISWFGSSGHVGRWFPWVLTLSTASCVSDLRLTLL